GTVVLYKNSLSGGSALTVELAKEHNKPCLVIDLCENPSPEILLDWLKRHEIRTLNVAGTRESASPGIYDEACQFLGKCLVPYIR
ncbi:MAG: molybdenum cofactor carrier, partial [Acidobacteria bacterium]|nr:molybdenum cofactor carrier [Acidobacteriota bacterium]